MKMNRISLKYPAKGFALIEVLVSVVLFTIGILGLVALQARGIQFSGDAEDRTAAALLASDLASTMWTDGTVDTTVSPLSTHYTTWKTTVQSRLPNGTGEAVAGTDSLTNTKIATITITWKAPSKDASADYNRYVTEVVIP